jgi:hypothetical protein
VQYCVASCSGVSIGVTVLGNGATFTFSGDALWTGNFMINHQCPTCVATTPDECGPTCDPYTPILIDLGRPGIELTDLASGVRFDLDRDGFAERLSWTLPRSEDAFLVLDVNRNGKIDDGSELFGNFTLVDPKNPRNGYQALALYDEIGFGGNQDGWITKDDIVFDSLRLWRDDNHDGASEPAELFRLEEFGIRAISLSYIESRHRDRYGNELRFRGKVETDEARPVTWSADVFLLHDRGE